MNPYREFTGMHSICEFLQSLDLGDFKKIEVRDIVSGEKLENDVVRAGICKVCQRIGIAVRTRYAKHTGELLVKRIK